MAIENNTKKSLSENTKKPLSGESKQSSDRPLEKINYLLMGASMALIVIGFFLISGDPTTEERFNPDIFSTVRIGVGPTLSFLGFVMMFFAILYKKRK